MFLFSFLVFSLIFITREQKMMPPYLIYNETAFFPLKVIALMNYLFLYSSSYIVFFPVATPYEMQWKWQKRRECGKRDHEVFLCDVQPFALHILFYFSKIQDRGTQPFQSEIRQEEGKGGTFRDELIQRVMSIHRQNATLSDARNRQTQHALSIPSI